MRCRNVDGIHIPGCAGCANTDHDNCTCIGSRSVSRERRTQVERMWNTAMFLKQRGHSDAAIIADLDRMLADYNERRRNGSA